MVTYTYYAVYITCVPYTLSACIGMSVYVYLMIQYGYLYYA